jgi:hypothetical protein
MRFLILLLFLSSCSAGRLIQMACKKDPALCRADTVVITNEKPVLIQKIDTVYQTDTTVVYRSKDSVIIRLVYRAGRVDTVKAECPPSVVTTVYKPVLVPAPTTTGEKWRIRWTWTAILAISAAVLYLGILAGTKGLKGL